MLASIIEISTEPQKTLCDNIIYVIRATRFASNAHVIVHLCIIKTFASPCLNKQMSYLCYKVKQKRYGIFVDNASHGMGNRKSYITVMNRILITINIDQQQRQTKHRGDYEI